MTSWIPPWVYDTSPTKGIGKLHTTTVRDSANAITYAEEQLYDALGRPSTLWRELPGDPFSVAQPRYFVTQTYDSVGRVLKTVYPTGFQTRNVYNTFGYLKEVRKYEASDEGKANSALTGYIYWMAERYDVTGKIAGEIYGNGLVNDRFYNERTGRLYLATIGRGFEAGQPPYSVQYLNYTYDAVGNVLARSDTSPEVNRSEAFTYDPLDRLKSQTINGGPPVTVTYDAKGNLTAKSDVGNYTYAGAGPHAVSGVSGGPLGTQSYSYDNNGNLNYGGGRSLAWTSFNQIASVMQGSAFSQFSFGASHERVKQVSHLGTTLYIGGLFERVIKGSAVENKHYIFGPTGRIAVYTERNDTGTELRYFHTDGLGSITAVSNELGQVVQRFAYDAWGKRVNPQTGSTITGTTNGSFTRGFTDHEHLDDLGLIHMNGRVYDPVLGRFMSADPFVGNAGDSQDYNRYSYLGNNPLGGTDPSGFFSLKDAVKIVAVVVAAYFTAGAALYLAGGITGVAAGATATFGNALAALAGTGGFGVTLGGAIAAGAGAGFASGFAGSLLNGGSIGDAFKAGIIGGVVGGIAGGLTYGIGSLYQANKIEFFDRMLAHGVVQGGVSEAQGGQFRHGFYAGFFTAGASPFVGKGLTGAIESAVIGGTASAIGGGKFANGAISAAFQFLLNDAQDHSEKMSNGERKSAIRHVKTVWKAGGKYDTIDEMWVPIGEDHNSWGSTGRGWVALLKQSLGIDMVKPMDVDSMTVVQVESLVAEYTFETTAHYKVFDTATEKFLRNETQVEDRYVYRTFRTSTLPLPPEGITWTNPKNYAVPAWKGSPVPWNEWQKNHRY